MGEGGYLWQQHRGVLSGPPGSGGVPAVRGSCVRVACVFGVRGLGPVSLSLLGGSALGSRLMCAVDGRVLAVAAAAATAPVLIGHKGGRPGVLHFTIAIMVHVTMVLIQLATYDKLSGGLCVFSPIWLLPVLHFISQLSCTYPK